MIGNSMYLAVMLLWPSKGHSRDAGLRTFNRNHAGDLAIISKDKLLDSLKALLDKGLHIAGLLCLSQNLQQLIVGQEEEPSQL